MARSPRFEELGLPYHVIIQGMERGLIFRDDVDRITFLLRALAVFREMGIEVLAWVLMGNHAHFVLRATKGRLSKAMQRVLGPYARGFNIRHDRVGRLFRDRFWSRPVEDDTDLVGLIGYVLLNPLRGGIVSSIAELEAYEWSSLAELRSPPIGREPLVDLAQMAYLFGDTTSETAGELLALIAGQYADDPEGLAFRQSDPGQSRALTDRERKDLRAASTHALRLRDARVDAVLAELDTMTALRLRLVRRGWTLNRVLTRAAELSQINPREIRSGAKHRAPARARGLVAHFAGTYLGCSAAEIARACGVSRQSIPLARVRGAEAADMDPIDWRDFFELPEEDELAEAAQLDEVDSVPVPAAGGNLTKLTVSPPPLVRGARAGSP